MKDSKIPNCQWKVYKVKRSIQLQFLSSKLRALSDITQEEKLKQFWLNWGLLEFWASLWSCFSFYNSLLAEDTKGLGEKMLKREIVERGLEAKIMRYSTLYGRKLSSKHPQVNDPWVDMLCEYDDLVIKIMVVKHDKYQTEISCLLKQSQ